MTNSFFTVDVHNHILPERLPDFKKKFGYGGFVTLKNTNSGADMMMDDGSFFRAIEHNCLNTEVRLEQMKKLGIDVQVLSTIPVMFSYWAKPSDCDDVCSYLNEDLAKRMEAHPKNLLGIGSLPLMDTQLSIAQAKNIKSLGLSGIQIGSHVGEMNLDDEKLFPLYEELENLNLPVLVHPWDMMGADTMSKYWLPWLVGMPAEGSRAISSMIFGGVFDKFPKLRVMFAHAGGSFLGTLGRIDHAYHSRPDLCAININKAPSEYLKHFYIDSITHDEDALHYAIKKMSVDRIALGSDFPFPLGEHHPGELIKTVSSLTDAQKERLLSGTALEWLGIKKERFN